MKNPIEVTARLARAISERPRQTLSLAHATLVVTAVEIGLRTLPVPTLSRLLGIEVGLGRGHSANGAKATSRPTLVRIERVHRALGIPSTCLRQSLAQGFILRALKPVLRFGSEEVAGQLHHHAWVDFGRGTLPTSEVESRRFRSLGRSTH